jgi:hypothetical protein
MLNVDGVKIKVKLDSGASCNVLPKEQFIRLPVRRQRLRPGPRLRRYGAKDGYLTVLGVHTAKEVANGFVTCWILSWSMTPVRTAVHTGFTVLPTLNLIRRVYSVSEESPSPPETALVKEYIDVFTGIG